MTVEAADTHPSADLEPQRNVSTSCSAATAPRIVAFSGGVDSALVAVTAARVLGHRALCVTADSPSYPDASPPAGAERGAPVRPAARVHLHRRAEPPEYRSNPVNRCYYCKNELYTTLAAMASARGMAVVADGSNADDRGDYRPGRQAAREYGVRSPLDEVGLTKAEHPRAGARPRHVHVGRARVGLPVVARSVPHRRSPTRRCG